jgi:anaerobic ribonucleoside-triphosphate reductase activating protein
MDISNGPGVGVSLFVQGCHLHCKGCFNSTAWDFNGGKEWNDDVKQKFLELASKPYIKRISILGGEPLSPENSYDLYELITEIKDKLPDKVIWLYTGYLFEYAINNQSNRKILELCDVVVDDRYVEELKDIGLPWCGSSNQRVIDVQETLKQNKIVLYDK